MKEVDKRLKKKGKGRGRGKGKGKKGRGRGKAGAVVEDADGEDDYIPYYEIEVDDQDEPIADSDE